MDNIEKIENFESKDALITFFKTWIHFFLFSFGIAFIIGSYCIDAEKNAFAFNFTLGIGISLITIGAIYFLFKELNKVEQKLRLDEIEDIMEKVFTEEKYTDLEYIVNYEESTFEYTNDRNTIFFTVEKEIVAKKENVNKISIPFSWSGSEKNVKEDNITLLMNIRSIRLKNESKSQLLEMFLKETLIVGVPYIIKLRIQLSDLNWEHTPNINKTLKKADDFIAKAVIMNVKFPNCINDTNMPKSAYCYSVKRDDNEDRGQRYKRSFNESRVARKILTSSRKGRVYTLEWEKPNIS